MKRHTQRCTYCGAKGRVTDDHVPPATIFAHPRPSNLRTVPCCPRCNHDGGQDDEYFRDTLAMREDLSEDPSIQGVIGNYYRSLARPRVAAYKREMIDNIRPINVISPGGIFLRRAVGCSIDGARLARVVTRTVRGLFYWHESRRLPSDCPMVTYERSAIPTRELAQAFETMAKAVAQHGNTDTIGDAFRYGYIARPEHGKDVSWWLLEFYQKVHWLVVTGRLNKSLLASNE